MCVRSLVSHCTCKFKSCNCVCAHVCLQCNVLCFTSNPSPLRAPPYLSPMEMRRGQGIWGEEHREAALHNLKGILMNQHSRTAYSHDNRPQTNSCIWSPLVLWLWKCCMCVSVCAHGCFCFWGYSKWCVWDCERLPPHFSLWNWPGNWLTLMSTLENVITVCYDQSWIFIFYHYL